MEDNGFRGRRIYSRSSRVIKNLLKFNILDIIRQRALIEIKVIVLSFLIKYLSTRFPRSTRNQSQPLPEYDEERLIYDSPRRQR